MNLPLEAQIEAILFWKGEPVSLKKLAELLSAKPEQIISALTLLKNNLEGRGVALVEKDGEVMLGTTPAVSSLIEKLTKDELSRDLGKAGLETLSIILYQGPITRSEIDYIRGVNSTFILRNLLIRGLVEKVPHEEDARSFKYRVTFETLTHLGVRSIDELPDYQKVRADIAEFKERSTSEHGPTA